MTSSGKNSSTWRPIATTSKLKLYKKHVLPSLPTYPGLSPSLGRTHHLAGPVIIKSFLFFLYYQKSWIPNPVLCIYFLVIHTVALRKAKIGFTYFWQSKKMSPCPHILRFTRKYQALQEDTTSCQYCVSKFSGCLLTLRLLSPIPEFLIQLAGSPA